jgi:hypothetical protein
MESEMDDGQLKRIEPIRRRLQIADAHGHLGTAGKELLRLCDVLLDVPAPKKRETRAKKR